MYVYINSEPGLWTVGFYDPSGKWVPESDHKSEDDATERVAKLNGTNQIARFFDRNPVLASVLELRDMMAMAAMQAVINDSWRSSPEMEGRTYGELAHGIAEDAYEIADAMLETRAAKP